MTILDLLNDNWTILITFVGLIAGWVKVNEVQSNHSKQIATFLTTLDRFSVQVTKLTADVENVKADIFRIEKSINRIEDFIINKNQ